MYHYLIKRLYLIILFCAILLTGGCEKESPVRQNRVVIGITADISTFNPLFAFSVDEGTITELLFLSLINFTWDDEKGNINAEPMLAESWEWSDDSSSISFNLREDVFWSDGKKCSAYDLVFSFDIYSDPDVQSRLYETFTDFYADESNHIDLEKTFEVIDSFKVKINFLSNSTPTLPEIVFPVIPKHIFENIPRKEIETTEANFKPVTNGPFLVANWDKNQSVRLEANKNSFLHKPDGPEELIFKVVPDYSSRITQLKKKEIDLAELIKTEDIKELQQAEHLKINSQKGREYDYVGWSNIDYELYNSSGKIKPHKLFGSAAVRRALSHAINREEILDEYLLGYGQLSIGPVSPIFKDAVDSNLKPYDYNLSIAKSLLEKEGWKDINKDGILEKGDIEFRFKLSIPSGNPRRSYAATVIKNNLKQAGIDVTIETVEPGVLIDNMYEKKMDAWMIAWYIPIPINLKISWYSDLKKTPYNFAGYRSPEADRILDEISGETDPQKLNGLYKRLQKIIHDDEPVTFLYWVDNIVAYNKRIENININPLGAIHHCWEWVVKEQ